MLGLLTLDWTGTWDLDVYAHAGEHISDMPNDEQLREHLEMALDFQVTRGGGTFVLNLADR